MHRKGRICLVKRPLCVFCGSFLAALLASSFFYGRIKPIAAAVCILIFVIFLVIFLRGKRSSACAATAIVCLGIAAALVLSYLYFDVRYKSTAEKYTGREAECELVVTRTLVENSMYCRYETTVYEIDGEKTDIRAILETEYEAFLDVGDRVSVKGNLSGSRTGASLNEGYYLSKGFFLTISSGSSAAAEQRLIGIGDYSSFDALVGRLSRGIYSKLSTMLDKRSAGVMRALICADKSTLDNELSTSFKILGLSHMLAVSGMHLGIIAGLVRLLMNVLPIGRRSRSLLVLALSLVYVIVCAFTPSICRSLGMLSVLFLEPFSRRDRDIVTSLFFSVTVICLISPCSIIDIGLLASFLSTLGIVTLGAHLSDKIRTKRRITHAILDPLILTYSATVFVMPLSVFCFGSLSIIAPVANIIFLPILTLVMYSAPVLLVLSFSPLAYAIPAAVTSLLCSALCSLADLMSLDIFLISLDFDLIACLTVPFCALAIFFTVKSDVGDVLLPIALALFVGGAVTLNYVCICPEMTEPLYVSDGKNDALILVHKRSAMIIDNSSGGGSFVLECIDKASEYGASVDTVLFTHPHTYQQSGISRALAKCRVKRVVLMDLSDDNYYNLPEYLERNEIILDRLGNTCSFSYGDFIVNVSVGGINRSEHDCTVTRVTAQGKTTVYLGASSWENADLFDAATVGSVDRIIVGSHGPKIKTDLTLPEKYKNIEMITENADVAVVYGR